MELRIALWEIVKKLREEGFSEIESICKITPDINFESTHKPSYNEKNIDKFKNALHNRNWDDI